MQTQSAGGQSCRLGNGPGSMQVDIAGSSSQGGVNTDVAAIHRDRSVDCGCIAKGHIGRIGCFTDQKSRTVHIQVRNRISYRCAETAALRDIVEEASGTDIALRAESGNGIVGVEGNITVVRAGQSGIQGDRTSVNGNGSCHRLCGIHGNTCRVARFSDSQAGSAFCQNIIGI